MKSLIYYSPYRRLTAIRRNRRTMFSQKGLDLANLVAVALFFNQFLDPDPVQWGGFFIGVGIFVGAYTFVWYNSGKPY